MAIRDAIDRGWSWVVLLASFGIFVFVGSTLYGAGVIYVFLLETFQEDPVKTSWVGSLSGSLCTLVGPLAGYLTSRTCCRVSIMIGGLLCLIGFATSSFVKNLNLLFLTYGVLVGAGNGFAYTPAVVVLGYYFRKKLDLACGLAMTGCGLGMVIGPLCVRWLSDQYGWRGMFLLMGAINFNICLFGALCCPSSTEMEQKSLRATYAEDFRLGMKQRLQVFRNVSFVMFCLAIFVNSFACSIMFMHFPKYCMERGAATQDVTALFTLMSAASIITRVLAGLGTAGDPANKYLYLFGSYGLSGIAVLTFPLLSASTIGRYVFSVVFGMYIMVSFVVLNPITIELVGLLDLAMAFGIQMSLCGIGALLGPPVAALVMEMSGDYSASAYLSGSLMLVSSVFGMLIMVFKRPIEITEIIVEETNLAKLSKSLENMAPAQFLRSLTSLPGVFGASIDNIHLPTVSFTSHISPLAAENNKASVST